MENVGCRANVLVFFSMEYFRTHRLKYLIHTHKKAIHNYSIMSLRGSEPFSHGAAQLRGFATVDQLSAILYKGYNFCGFMFVFREDLFTDGSQNSFDNIDSIFF